MAAKIMMQTPRTQRAHKSPRGPRRGLCNRFFRIFPWDSLKGFFTFALLSCLPLFSQAANKLQIVTSFSVLSGLAKEIAGESVEITSLMPLSADPHHYSPSVKDLQRLQNADLILINGLNFENWLEPLLQAQKLTEKVVRLSNGITPIAIPSTQKMQKPSYDPHAWLSAKNAEIYAKNLCAAFGNNPKISGPLISTRCLNFAARINQLRARIAKFKELHQKQKLKILIPHEALSYLGEEMGLEVFALHSFNLSDFESGSKALKINTSLSEGKYAAAFAETSTSSPLFDRLVQENKVKRGNSLQTESISNLNSETPYTDLLEKNFEAIAKALSEN